MTTEQRPPYYQVVGREIWRMAAWLLLAVLGSTILVGASSELQAGTLVLVAIPSALAIGVTALMVLLRTLQWTGVAELDRATSFLPGAILVVLLNVVAFLVWG